MVPATAFFSQNTALFAVFGLATGALSGLVALSLVIVHRVSGILNFAAAPLGAIGAFVCYSLRDDGWPTPLAVVVGLIVGVLLGAVTYLVMALLRNSSLLSRMIATLALFSVAEGLMQILWTNQLIQPAPFLPSRDLQLGHGLRIPEDRLILIGIVILLAALLWAVYRWSRFGLATSAVSENRRVAAIAGWAPERIELVNFVVAGLLSALAAILLAPIVTLNAAILSTAILPALAAALAGRFSSFTATVGAALVIGAGQSELSLFQPDIAGAWHVSASSLTGLPTAVPLVVIIIVMVAGGRTRPDRGETGATLPMPGSGHLHRPLVAVGIMAGVVLVLAAPSYSDALITTFGMGIIIASVVVVSGYAGQLSLCQYSLAGFGAWAAARTAHSLGLSFPVAVIVGVIAAAAVGVLIGLPSLRTRGVALATITLAFSLVLSALIFDNGSLTGGFEGVVVARPEILGYQLDPTTHPQRYAMVVFVALVCVGLGVARLRVGATGRRMIAVRSNERAAAAVGVRVGVVKLSSFALAAGIAGLGGVLLAFQESNVQFTSFDIFASILLVQLAVIGGLGWVSGSVLGAVVAPGALIATVSNNLFPSFDIDAWLAIVGGLGVIQLLWQAPDGLASLWAGRLRRFRRFPDRRLTSPLHPTVSEPRAMGRARGRRLLEVSDVSVGFGGVVAVDHASFSVTTGDVVGLIGPNGAGKTTMLDLISGFARPNTGAVALDGIDMSRWSPARRARAGVSRSWQSVELFDELTVGDNLRVAERPSGRHLRRRLRHPGHRSLSSFAADIVDRLELGDILDERPDVLSYGVRKRVGIARAIVANADVVLLDEPTAGLDENERHLLARLIGHIATAHEMAVLIVEHDTSFVLDTCGRVIVLESGHVLEDGSPHNVASGAHVLTASAGAHVDAER